MHFGRDLGRAQGHVERDTVLGQDAVVGIRVKQERRRRFIRDLLFVRERFDELGGVLLGAEEALQALPDRTWARYLLGDGTRRGEGDRLDLGSHALRFTLAALAAPGTDPSLGETRLLGYKAFVNKLWNASRFVLMNLEGPRAESYDFKALPLTSRWILSRAQDVAGRVEGALREFRFDRAAHELYHFVWDELCDWYIETAKPALADPAQAPVTRAVLFEALETALRLLHPIMPYVTEEIWQRLPVSGRARGPSIMVAPFPKPDPGKSDPAAEEAMQPLMRLVTGIRTIRATYEVAPRRRIDVTVVAPAAKDRAFLEEHAPLIRSLAALERLEIVAEAPELSQTIRQPLDGMDVRIPMAGLFDITAEMTRLSKERLKIEAELDGLRRKLANPQFVERANPEVVAQSRARVAELEALRFKVDGTLTDLRGTRP
jgi:valyl-tRNA synthetase